RSRCTGSSQCARPDRRAARLRRVERSGQPTNSRHLPRVRSRRRVRGMWIGAEPDRLAMDETGDRSAMIAALSTLAILMLLAWRLRPRPPSRGVRRTATVHGRPPRRMVLGGIATATLAVFISPVLA